MKSSSWPVAITTCIVAVFLGVIAFIIFSLHHREDLVAPDYYSQEIRYQQHIDSMRRAQQFTNGPILEVRGRVAEITIPNPIGATGSVHLYRPSDARLDQNLVLALDEQGRQQMDLAFLAPGLWRIQLTWTVSNQTFAVETSSVL